jgi:N-acetylneuraminic acid mutarotase
MVALLLSSLQAAGSLGLYWDTGPNMPRPSGGHATAVLGDGLFVVGGTNWQDDQKFWLDDIARYDLASRSWSAAGHLPISIAYAASASGGERLYLCGGSDGEADLPSCLALSLGGSGLRCRPMAPLPAARVYAGGGICDGVLYVVGGAADHADLTTVTGSLFALDLDDSRGQWRERAALPEARFIPAVAAAGGKLFVFGGGRLNAKGEPENLASCWAYSPGGNSWERLPDLPRASRGTDAVAVGDDLILLFGGYTATAQQAQAGGPAFGFLDEVIAFRPSARTFERVGRMPYAAIGTAPVFAGDSVYLTGGEDRMRHRAGFLSIASVR